MNNCAMTERPINNQQQIITLFTQIIESYFMYIHTAISTSWIITDSYFSMKDTLLSNLKYSGSQTRPARVTHDN